MPENVRQSGFLALLIPESGKMGADTLVFRLNGCFGASRSLILFLLSL